MTAAASGLAVLGDRLARDLSLLELPTKSWVAPRFEDGERVRDVVVVGGGMCGLAATAQLRLLGVDNVVCYDRAPKGREGPWVTTARMRTLRSPKSLTGPALKLPSLTFRAWYEAQFGADAWARLGKIPRPQWMDYLIWYREVMRLPVENEIEIFDIRSFDDNTLAVDIDRIADGRRETVLTRHIVLATGRDGLGGPYVPEMAAAIDPTYWAHSSDEIDFTALKGKRVGVIGAGASAMDNAATALEAGCRQLDLFIRRKDIPRINKFTGIGSQGVVHGFTTLPEDWKWKFFDYVLDEQTPPPGHSVRRVSSHENAYFHLASPIRSMTIEGGAVRIVTPRGSYQVDFVIFATGYAVDLDRRPEIRGLAPFIQFWGGAHAPGDKAPNVELSMSPSLGSAFEFIEKDPGACPALSRVHCFNYPASLSHGKLTGDIPAVSDGALRLTQGIIRRLFVEDRATYFSDLQAYDVPELDGDEWVDADPESLRLATG
jgi:cation diffusion facilitator CzcD-associated flavoprotein CzcO